MFKVLKYYSDEVIYGTFMIILFSFYSEVINLLNVYLSKFFGVFK